MITNCYYSAISLPVEVPVLMRVLHDGSSSSNFNISALAFLSAAINSEVHTYKQTVLTVNEIKTAVDHNY